MRKHVLVMVLVVSTGLLAMGLAGEDMTLAVIPCQGDESLPQESLSALETASAIDGVKLMKHADVLKILANEEPNAKSLADSARRSGWAKRLRVPLLVFARRICPRSVGTHMEATFVDGTEGLVLGSWTGAVTEWPNGTEPYRDALALAVDHARVPSQNRLPLRVECAAEAAPSDEMERLAMGLETLLDWDLGRTPRLILLTPPDLVEKTVEAKPFLFATQVRSTFKRLAPGKVEVKVTVQPFSGKSQTQVLVLEDAPGRLRETLASSVLKMLGIAGAPRPEKVDVAKVLASRANTLFWNGSWQGALRAAEGACVLAPTEEMLCIAGNSWGEWAEVLTEQAATPKTKPSTARDLTLRALRLGLRKIDLDNKANDLRKEAWKRGGKVPLRLPARLPSWDMECSLYDLYLKNRNSPDPDVRRLHLQLSDATLKKYHAMLDYYREHWDDPPGEGDWGPASYHFFIEFKHAPRYYQTWSPDASTFSTLIKKVADQYASFTKPLDPQATHERGTFIEQLCGGMNCADDPEYKQCCADLALWLTQHRDPGLQIAGLLSTKSTDGRQDVTAIRKAVEVYCREFPLTHEYRNDPSSEFLDNSFGNDVRNLPEPKDVDELCAQLLTPVIREGNPKRIAAWGFLIQGWIERVPESTQLPPLVRQASAALRTGGSSDEELKKALDGYQARSKNTK